MNAHSLRYAPPSTSLPRPALTAAEPAVTLLPPVSSKRPLKLLQPPPLTRRLVKPRALRKRDRRSAHARLERALRMARVTYEHLILVRKPEADDPEVAGNLSLTWSQALLKELAVDVFTSGAPALPEPGLLVSNHTGFLDILVWLSTTPCCFLAKEEVQYAPMVGEGASRLGTVWLERACKDSRTAAREAIARAIVDQGRRVVVFPEGTTSRAGLPWRYGSFVVAKKQGLWVQAAAMRFGDLQRSAWVDEFFAGCLWEFLAAEREQVELHRFEPVKITDPAFDVPRLERQVNAWLGRETPRAEKGRPRA